MVPLEKNPGMVFITHEYAPFLGGVATYVEEAAAAIQRTGRPVEIWAPEYTKCVSCPECPVTVVRLHTGGTLQWRHRMQFAREIFKRRQLLGQKELVVASVGAHMAFMMLSAMGLIQCQKMTSLLHGSEILRFKSNWLWRWFARAFYKKVTRVITVSEFSRALIQKSFLGEIIGKIELAPCAGTSAVTKTISAPASIDGKIRILTLARIHPRKGQLDVAKALSRLPESLRAGVVYQVGGIGDLNYLDEVKRVCQIGGVALEYLGAVESESLAVTYAHCDIYAMTSRTLPKSVEGFGITYLDAGFHGKPVVAYRSGGASEAVVDGKTGLLADEGDLDALQKIFSALIESPALRQKLGAGGKEHAAQFSWDKTAEVFIGHNQDHP